MAPPPAVVVSDLTCFAVLGMRPRFFRSFVKEHHIPHVRTGRRMLVRLDRIVAVVDRLSGTTARPCAGAWDEAATVAAAARGAA